MSLYWWIAWTLKSINTCCFRFVLLSLGRTGRWNKKACCLVISTTDVLEKRTRYDKYGMGVLFTRMVEQNKLRQLWQANFLWTTEWRASWPDMGPTCSFLLFFQAKWRWKVPREPPLTFQAQVSIVRHFGKTNDVTFKKDWRHFLQNCVSKTKWRTGQGADDAFEKRGFSEQSD